MSSICARGRCAIVVLVEKPRIYLVVHNIRSAHNVGSMLRTAEGMGVMHVYLTGYTPYPLHKNDQRLPHLSKKIDRQIHKTSLGAEKTVSWTPQPDILALLEKLKIAGTIVAALEQTAKATPLHELRPLQKVALIVGNEVEGLDKEVLDQVNLHLKIPMYGTKESFNVAVAAAIALYHLRFYT